MTNCFRGRLPRAVVDLALCLCADPAADAIRVRLGQSGQMRRNANRAWMPFKARQTLATDHCGRRRGFGSRRGGGDADSGQ